MADLFNTDPSDTNKGMTNIPELSVSELSGAVKRTVEDAFGFVRVRGEISKVTLAKSGHLYTTLKDENAALEAVAWKATVARLSIKPAEGMEVVATGRLTTYPGRSNYQLIIESIELAGAGAILKMLEDRKKKLAAEGLFDPALKKPLPFAPRVIGVVTSPTGAVIRDILHRLRDRFPVHVLLWPVNVQGANAAGEVVRGIVGLNNLDTPPDLIIVARGGGSIEDLMPFNDESVVRAAAESVVPLISAVGHETDVTLIDFAADKRAPTPTAAAEMAVPVRDDLLAQLHDWAARMNACTRAVFKNARRDIDHAARVLGNIERVLEGPVQRLDRAGLQLDRAFEKHIASAERKLSKMALRTPQESLVHATARLDQRVLKMGNAWQRHVSGAENRLAKIRLRTPDDMVNAMSLRLVNVAQRLKIDLNPYDKNVAALARTLETLSYRNTLARGFAVVRAADGKPVSSVKNVKSGDAVTVEFHDGKTPAKIS